MTELVKQWEDGSRLTATYEGSGDGDAVFISDANEGIDREMSVSFIDTSGSIVVERRVSQEGLRQPFGLSGGGVFRLANGGRYGVLKVGNPIEPPAPMETYTRLTYIECTGEQYIDTGYIVQEDDVIDMYYITTSTTSADKALFGVYDDDGNIWATIYSNTAYIRFGSDSSSSISNARQRYKLTLQKGSVDIDGSKGTPAFTSMPTSPLYLFARNNKNAGVSMYGFCQTFGFRITKASGEVVMNLKPCKRDSDNAIGMLDLITGTFFVNQGSGDDFAYGAEVKLENGYEAIDYVTFNANKLYDAGIINSNQTIEVLFERTETAKTPYLYGVITSPHTASVSAYMSSGGAWRFGAYYKGYGTNTTKMYKVEVSNGKVVFDYTSGTFTKTTFTTPNTLVVGGMRAASGSTSKSYIGYIYYFRVKQGSEYIADWYPCRRLSDGAEGFWDCVTQTFVESL